MQILEFIAQKRDGLVHSDKDILAFIEGLDTWEDYQITAWLMAVCCQGLEEEEILVLTEAMYQSGDQIQFDPKEGLILDKHSTGGVGDKTSLVIVPILASLGYKVCKLSGRGLGHTGGTIDKLESFTGFQHELTPEEIKHQMADLGYIIAGQSATVAPADKALYALRDVSSTVPSLPLIASSIMSKKLATGCHVLVLDVKCGSGSFLKDHNEARVLGELMKHIGIKAGLKVDYLISDMSAPLGFMVGNDLEVEEAISLLSNNTSHGKLLQCCMNLCISSMQLVHPQLSTEDCIAQIKAKLTSLEALNHLKQMIEYQGGTWKTTFSRAKFSKQIDSPKDGTIRKIDALEIGKLAMMLGAGRQSKSDSIDLKAGIALAHSLGDQVSASNPLMTLFSSDPQKLASAIAYLEANWTAVFQID